MNGLLVNGVTSKGATIASVTSPALKSPGLAASTSGLSASVAGSPCALVRPAAGAVPDSGGPAALCAGEPPPAEVRVCYGGRHPPPVFVPLTVGVIQLASAGNRWSCSFNAARKPDELFSM